MYDLQLERKQETALSYRYGVAMEHMLVGFGHRSVQKHDHDVLCH